jgi:hypothetical protein
MRKERNYQTTELLFLLLPVDPDSCMLSGFRHCTSITNGHGGERGQELPSLKRVKSVRDLFGILGWIRDLCITRIECRKGTRDG